MRERLVHMHTWRQSFGFTGSIQNSSVVYVFFSVYTPEQLAEKYSNITFLLYCLILILLVALHHSIYRWDLGASYFTHADVFHFSHLFNWLTCFNMQTFRRGEHLLAVSGQDLRPYWNMLLPFSYAVVSGAVGSFSVLFAKSL